MAAPACPSRWIWSGPALTNQNSMVLSRKKNNYLLTLEKWEPDLQKEFREVGHLCYILYYDINKLLWIVLTTNFWVIIAVLPLIAIFYGLKKIYLKSIYKWKQDRSITFCISMYHSLLHYYYNEKIFNFMELMVIFTILKNNNIFTMRCGRI